LPEVRGLRRDDNQVAPLFTLLCFSACMFDHVARGCPRD
jgi:hypothetical protein